MYITMPKGIYMNYQKIYDHLITNAKNRKLEVYTEFHHIIPKCMGGDNSIDNFVRLTAKEHYVAHHLLYKIHRTSKLAHAWFSMLRMSNGQQRVFTSIQYEKVKLAHIKALKSSMKGANNPFYGKHHTAETRKKLSECSKKQIKTQKNNFNMD